MVSAAERDVRGAWWAFGIAAAVLAVVWGLKVLVFPRPFWAAQTDLEVDFFFNSLLIAEEGRPGRMLHPATPIYYLGGVIAHFLQAGPADIQAFLHVGHVIGLLVTLGALWLFARSVLVHVPGVLAKVAILLSVFLNGASLLYLTYWGSEMFLVPCGLLAWWALWRAFHGPEPLACRTVIFAGTVCGFACAVKMVFVPLIVAAVVGLSAWVWATKQLNPRRFAISNAFLLVWGLMSAGFLALLLGTTFWRTQPKSAAVLVTACLGNIVLLVMGAVLRSRPCGALQQRLSAMLRVNYEYLFGVLIGWVAATWPMSRFYGAVLGRAIDGAIAHPWLPGLMTGPVDWLKQFWLLLLGVPAWALLALITAMLLVASVWQGWQGRTPARPAVVGFGLALGTSLFLGMIMAFKARAPGAMVEMVRYSGDGVELRFFALATVTIAYALAWLTSRHATATRRGRRPVKVGLAVIPLILMAAFSTTAARDIRGHRELIQHARQEKAAIEARLDQIATRLGRRPVIVIPTFGLALPSTALRGGDFNAGYKHRQAIDALYPYEGEMVPWREIVVPTGQEDFDLVLLKASSVDGPLLQDLKQLGSIERWSDSFPEPLLVVKKTEF